MNRTRFHKKRRLRVRRFLLVLIALLLVAVVAVGVVFLVHAPGRDDTPADTPPPTVEQEDAPPNIEPARQLPVDFIARNTKAPRILLYDLSAETVLFSKNEDEQCAPASLTKLMTAIVALENADPDTVITAGDELYLLDPESSRAGIYIGHTMTLEQAIQGLLLKSGNDAAYVIAAQIGHKMDPSLSGKAAIDHFCKAMTQKAKELGCTATTFRNPDGIDAEGHLTTAADLLKISLYALEQPLIAETVASTEVTTTFQSGQTKTWQNSNKLLEGGAYAYAGTCGMKTGSTDGAGNCLISCATRDGRTVLCILLGADTDFIRYNETIELLNLSFD